MSLRAFHIVFLIVSTALSLLVGGWNFRAWRFSGDNLHLLMSIGAFLAAVGLVFYGQWFLRKIRTTRIPPLVIVLIGFLLTPRAAEACTVCYGEAAGPMIDGAKIGVYVLYGLVVLVQIGIISFFLVLRNRAKKYAAKQTTLTARGI